MNVYYFCAILWGLCACVNIFTMIVQKSFLYAIIVILNIICCVLYCIKGMYI